MSFIPLEHLLRLGRRPDAVVALRDGAPLHWHAFAAGVAGVAATLTPGRRYALLAQDAWHFAIALCACWQAGAEAVIPHNAQTETLVALADGFDATLDDAAIAAAPAGDGGSLRLLDGDAARLTLYTSGSSGAPKAIAKCLRQLSAEVAVLEQCWGATMADAPVLATVPHHHIYGVLFRLLWPLAAGRPFEVLPRFLPQELLAAARRWRRVVLVASPAQLSRLPELIPLAALQPQLAICFSSGGPLPAATAAAFAASGEAPLEVFGSTETGGIAWRRQQHGDAAWTPLPQVDCSAAADGALRIASPFLLDAAPWLTSDAVSLQADGRFVLGPRLDRVVKLEEKRLSLAEQEHRLAAHPWVAAAALLVLPARRQTLCAVLQLSAAGEAALAEGGKLALGQALRAHLAGWYEAVLLPRRWRVLPALPLTERGKPDWAAMRALFD